MTEYRDNTQPGWVAKLWEEDRSLGQRGEILYAHLEQLRIKEIKELDVPRSVADRAFRLVREKLDPNHITQTAIKACWLPAIEGRDRRTRRMLDTLFQLSERGDRPHSIEAYVTEDLKPPQRVGLGELERFLDAPLSDGLLADLFLRTLRRYSQNHFQSNQGQFFLRLIKHPEAGRQTLQTAARMLAASYRTKGQQPHTALMEYMDFVQHPIVRELFLESGSADMLLLLCTTSPDPDQRRQAFLKCAREDPHRTFGFLEGLHTSQGEWPSWLEGQDLSVFLQHPDQQIRETVFRWMQNLSLKDGKTTLEKDGPKGPINPERPKGQR